MIDEAIDAYRSTGAEQALPYGYLLLGRTLLKAGQPRNALSALEHASRLGDKFELRLYAAEILRLRARAEARLGSRPDRAIALVEEAIHIARQQGALLFAARAEETARGLLGMHRISIPTLATPAGLVLGEMASVPGAH